MQCCGLLALHLLAREGWQAIYRTNNNLMRSPNGHDKPLETLQRSASFAQTRIKSVQKQAALAVEAAQVNLALVQVQMAKIISPPDTSSADIAVMAEIRSHVRSIKDHAEREAFIEAASAANDLRTLRAVIGAPHYLSGTIPQTHQRWQADFLRAAAPGLVTASDQLEQGIELAQVAARSIEQHARELIDFRKAADLNALANELENV